MNDKTFELLLFLLVFTVYAASLGADPLSEKTNVQVGQAVAVLEGRFDLPSVEFSEEYVVFTDGKLYSIHPPLASILLLPIVLVFGPKLKLNLIIILIGSLNAVLCYKILRKHASTLLIARILVLAFAFGTVHWWVSLKHKVWFMDQILAVFFGLMILNELFGRANPFYLGFFLGCSFLCRQVTLFLGVAVLGVLFIQRGRREFMRSALVFACVTAFFVGVYIFLNFIKFGSPLNTGYQELPWFKGRPLFSLKYLPFNLYTFLIAAPQFSEKFPYLSPTDLGHSLIFTSPFLLYAFYSRLPLNLKTVLWASVFLMAVPGLLYQNNGYAQFGFRFILDYQPLLMILVATAVSKINKTFLTLVGASIILNIIGAITLVPYISN
jgi:hypothetical protein